MVLECVKVLREYIFTCIVVGSGRFGRTGTRARAPLGGETKCHHATTEYLQIKQQPSMYEH